MRSRVIGPLSLAWLLVAGCSGLDEDEACNDFCRQLEDCRLLPSVLGVTGADVNESLEKVDNCIARCVGTEPETRQSITRCRVVGEAHSFDWCTIEPGVCRELSSCLDNTLPGVAATGRVSSLTLTTGPKESDGGGYCYCERSGDGYPGCVGGEYREPPVTSFAATGGCQFVARGRDTRFGPRRPCGEQSEWTFQDLTPGAYAVGIRHVDESSTCREFLDDVVLYAGGSTSVLSIDTGSIQPRPCEVCDDGLDNDADGDIDCDDLMCSAECLRAVEAQ